MTWPLSQDYNEAIQSPAGNFADPDLRLGAAACNALGIPMPCSGNFADVYQVRCPDGTRWAVKCFTREAPGLRERYHEISRHLRQVKLPFTVDFTYLEQGIRVAGRWYPVLKMQWVEGLTLNQFVKQYLDKPATLDALLQTWGRMAQYLRAAQVGHCDLQHGNVLLVPGASANMLALKLIDYDGMWVPALAGTKSGEIGHASYQHPQRLRDGTYSIDVDRFPVLLVATALRALKAQGRALWERYDNGDNLLFREADLRDPAQSGLLRELLQCGDAAPLAAALVKAVGAGLESTPLLGELTADVRAAAIPTPRPQRTPAAIRAVGMRAPAAPVAVAAPPAQGPWDYQEAVPPSRKGVPAGAVAAAFAVLVFVMTALAAVLYLATQGASDKPPLGAALARWDGSTDKPPLARVPIEAGANELTNSIGMKLVLIPAGTFLMGSPKDEEGRFDTEGPQHKVELTRPFYMGAYPVTKGQFGAFVKDAGYQTEAEKDGKGCRGYNAATRKLEQDPKYNWKDSGFTQTADHPVVNVTWNDATAFCAWLSKKEGRTYELPTEAEWEYACRAGTKTRFWCGDADASLKGNANVPDASLKGKLDADYVKTYSYSFVPWDDGYPFTSPVGRFNPNPWGLYDMSGNVWQWCTDRQGKYQDGFIKDPKGDEREEHCAMRGGTWLDDLRYCRSAMRGFEPPAARFDNLGFRVVLRFAPPR